MNELNDETKDILYPGWREREAEINRKMMSRFEQHIPLRCGISRQEWHDKAWSLYHEKTFKDTMLAKVNIHTIRAVFDATYDALINKT